MKITSSIIFLATLLFFCLPKNVCAQQAEQKVLVTLHNDEEIMYYESCIPLSFDQGNLYLVTRIGNQYFTYDNGTRQGPFKDTKSANLKNCNQNGDSQDNCSILKNEVKNQEKYMGYGSDGNMVVMYKGNTYSNFSQINEIVTSADGNKIAVYGTNAKWEPLFLTPAGTVIPVVGEPQHIVISPSGNVAIVAMKGSENIKVPTAEEIAEKSKQMEEDFKSVDFSKMTPEEIQEFSQKMQEKYGTEESNNNTEPDFFFFLSDGKKLGPFKLGGSAGDNPSFCTTGGDNWYFISENKLYIDGTMVKDYGDDSPSLCQVWISPDGKRYATYLNYDKLVFSDGQTYQSPMQIKTEIQNGKVYLTWLSIDAKNQLILYKKAI